MAALASDQSSSEQNRVLVGNSLVELGQISPIVQNVVVAARLGRTTSVEQYKEKKVAGLKGDFYVLQQMQQNKTAKLHCDTAQALIMTFC